MLSKYLHRKAYMYVGQYLLYNICRVANTSNDHVLSSNFTNTKHISGE